MKTKSFAGMMDLQPLVLLASLLAVVMFPLNLEGATKQFEAPLEYPVPPGPTAAAIGDLDGDGHPDLAVVNWLSNSKVSILLGNGDGTLQAAVSYGAGLWPRSLAIGDFDGDGHPDLAVTDFSRDSVSILLGDGDGTFQVKVDYGVGHQPESLAVGDFNGDGHSDLAVTNSDDGNVSILLGNGDGTFQAKVDYGVGERPGSLAVGDFDGDGHLDLAVANSGCSGWWCEPSRPGSVSVLLGNGDGTFQARVDYGAGDWTNSLATGDLNGDGYLDLAVANGASDTFSIYLGNGDGTFQPGVDYGGISSSTYMAIGDFDEDGHLDLVMPGDRSRLSIFLGNGDGTFQAPASCAGFADAVVVEDFNGDHHLDLATVHTDRNKVSIVFGNGDGTFQAPLTYLAGTDPQSVATEDFNGDGHVDLAVANAGSNNVSVLLGNGDGTFRTAVNYGAGDNPYSVAIGDFNGDGHSDLAVANSAYDTRGTSNVSVLLGNGDGAFQTAVNYGAGDNPHSVAIGDFDGDGHLDLAVLAIDIDDPDLFGNNVWVLLGNGDGTFEAAVAYPVGWSSGAAAVAVGDFNEDTYPDLAVANVGLYPLMVSHISVLLGNGDGTLRGQVVYGAGQGPKSIAIGDFNGDGHLDLAVANEEDDNVSIYVGNGNGAFTRSQVLYGVGQYPASIAIGDFNGDGHLDLAVANEEDDNVSVLINTGATAGCFIATAAFGTALDGKVGVLRSFRDAYLITSPIGKAFVGAYYSYSPPIAEYIVQHGWLKVLVRTLLLPVIGFVSLFV